MTVQVLHGDSREMLKTLPDNSIDSIVTDPPYELGFMGKAWDSVGVAYDVRLWQEVLRVLKPGGHLLAFGGSRTYHRMACAIEDAGFEVRDSVHWLYGSGFPKSHNVSKAIDKLDTDAAKQWDGFGTALKPAHEPIVVARKPLVGTVAANVLAYGTGALNIDASRVGSDGGYKALNTAARKNGDDKEFAGGKSEPINAGRWPANLVFTHAADCADMCAAGCPVAELDGQSGVSGGGSRKEGVARARNNGIGLGDDSVRSSAANSPDNYGDAGGASRFFTTTEWDPTADVAPFRYVAKPSKRERNAGLDGLPEGKPLYTEGTGLSLNGDGTQRAANTSQQNTHPTVKPVALMRWLVRLVTPPGGTVLDPFAGSGTTLVAATLEGFNSIGIEMTDDYLPIIDGRITWAEQQLENRLDLGDAA